jgi:hypothetical protein
MENKEICRICKEEIEEGEKVNIITEDGIQTYCYDCNIFVENTL